MKTRQKKLFYTIQGRDLSLSNCVMLPRYLKERGFELLWQRIKKSCNLTFFI